MEIWVKLYKLTASQKATTRTSWKELRTFAFGTDKTAGQDASSVWKQPFPLDIPLYPVRIKPKTQPRPSEQLSDGAQKIAKHLPPFPPSHTYQRSSLDNPKKRNSDDVDTDGSLSTARRVKRIQASKTIQQSIARLDTDTTAGSADSSTSSAVFEGNLPRRCRCIISITRCLQGQRWATIAAEGRVTLAAPRPSELCWTETRHS